MINSKRPVILINKEWCKGCGICIEFCPKNVYELIEGKPYPKREQECIKCKLCELRCPDFAITVRGDEND